jgi:hypothetical protein
VEVRFTIHELTDYQTQIEGKSDIQNFLKKIYKTFRMQGVRGWPEVEVAI